MNDPGFPPSPPLPGRRRPTHQNVSQCLVSFGSNLGDRRDLIAAAAKKIAESDLLLRGTRFSTSRLFETPPIGGPGGQEPFLNAVGVLETAAPAREVLELLQSLEEELGRERRRRWGARSIDLDVVLHGNLVGGTSGLVVPHPRYTARQFVLQPACDVAGHFRDPRFGWQLSDLSAHLSASVPSLALVTGRSAMREELCRRMGEEHGIRVIRPGETPPTDQRWVCGFLPNLPPESRSSDPLPRLLVRIPHSGGGSQWPAPHMMWPAGWRWPEYRLELEDMNWAVSELVSALDSMSCRVEPVTTDGLWW